MSEIKDTDSIKDLVYTLLISERNQEFKIETFARVNNQLRSELMELKRDLVSAKRKANETLPAKAWRERYEALAAEKINNTEGIEQIRNLQKAVVEANIERARLESVAENLRVVVSELQAHIDYESAQKLLQSKSR